MSPDPGAEHSAVFLERQRDFARFICAPRPARLLPLWQQFVRIFCSRDAGHLHCWVKLPAHPCHHSVQLVARLSPEYGPCRLDATTGMDAVRNGEYPKQAGLHAGKSNILSKALISRVLAGWSCTFPLGATSLWHPTTRLWCALHHNRLELDIAQVAHKNDF